MTLLPIQNAHFVKGLDPVANAFAGTVHTPPVNMGGFEMVTFLIHCGVGATGTATLTVEACSDITPTLTAQVPFYYREVLTGDTEGTFTAAPSTGYVTTAGSSKMIVISIHSQALAASGYGYARLTSVESVASPVLGGIIVMMSGGRDVYDKHATALV